MTKLRSFRFAGLVFLGAVTLLLSFETMTVANSAHAGFQADFRGDLFVAAKSILRGLNPYHPALLQTEANVLAAGGHWGLTISPRYPPISMLAILPLALLPLKVAEAIYVLLSSTAIVAALRLLGVRDPRAILVAAISSPVMYGVYIGQLTPWLMLATALMWHYRDRTRALPAAGALAIGLKLFLWPLGLWLLVSRRYRQFVLTGALTVGAILTSWALIRFAGMVSYPKMLVNIAYIGELRGSSVVSLFLHFGISTLPARLLALAIAALLVAAAWRMHQLSDGEQRSFGLIVIVALIASPVVWLHYLVLLFVPIALLSPRLSLIWFLPGFASFSPAGDVGLELILASAVCAPLLRELAAFRLPIIQRVAQPRFRSVASFLMTPM